MGSTGKDRDSTPLKVKDVAMCGDAKLLADAMKSHMGVEDLNTGNYGLEGSKLFECTKRKLDLPHGVDYNLHRHDIVICSLLHQNTQSKTTCVEESLSFVEHGVVYITSVSKVDSHASKWQIARLPPTFAQRILGTTSQYTNFVPSPNWKKNVTSCEVEG